MLKNQAISKAARSLGARGGLVTSKKYGKKHYEKMVASREARRLLAVDKVENSSK